VAVEVTTDCSPEVSWISRDWISPPRVRLKKAIDWAWRWLNTLVRSVCITRCPMVVASQVCQTPRMPVTAATTTIPTTSHTSRTVSCWGSATSMISRSRNGWASPTIDDTTMMATTAARIQPCPAKRRATRRRLTGDSASWARSAGFTRTGPRPTIPKPTSLMVPSWSEPYPAGIARHSWALAGGWGFVPLGCVINQRR